MCKQIFLSIINLEFSCYIFVQEKLISDYRSFRLGMAKLLRNMRPNYYAKRSPSAHCLIQQFIIIYKFITHTLSCKRVRHNFWDYKFQHIITTSDRKRAILQIEIAFVPSLHFYIGILSWLGNIKLNTQAWLDEIDI